MKFRKIFLLIVIVAAGLLSVNQVLHTPAKGLWLKSDSTHIKRNIDTGSRNDLIFWELLSGHLLSITE